MTQIVVPLTGLGGVDYAVSRRAGTLYQLTVHGALQSCGIGTILIALAARPWSARGVSRCSAGRPRPR